MAELLYPFVGHKPDAEVIGWARDFLADDGDTDTLEELDTMREDEALDEAKKILSDAGLATFSSEVVVEP